MESLLRAGANETITDGEGRKGADMIVEEIGEEDRLIEDIQRARKMLALAPADRAWRHRGYLVWCRAYSDKLLASRVVSSTRHSGTAGAEASGSHATVEGSSVGEIDGGDWAVVMVNLLRLREENIFRMIVGYL